MKKRRIVSILLAAGLALAACGVQQSTSEQTVNQQAETQNAAAAAERTEESRSPEGQLTVTEGAVLQAEDLAFPLGQKIESSNFTGEVYFAGMIQKDEEYNFPSTNNIIFAPSARSSWHEHGGMVVIGTGGVGYYQEEGKPVQIIKKGDVVEIPEGVRHWHGAAPDSWFSQIVIYDTSFRPEEGAEHGEIAVSDEEYANLKVAPYEKTASGSTGDFMFEKAADALHLETFSGPAYVSSVLADGNTAGAPSLHYVVFDNGVINNWHTHEGGQILIATDGVGFHQTEGGKVEILHPGDVAFCPPGVKHWHGGSKDTQFAHLAVNTNPEKTGLAWFDRISEQEYDRISALQQEGPIAATTAGSVRGTEQEGIYRFLGVPYAEAKERFVRASRVTPWDGVKDATVYGSISPQGSIAGVGAAVDQTGTDNNSQNLNIWTPGLADGKKRAVMVWLHGGGFSTGSANDAEYDGEALSREGDVVVVGVNHRLNVFGHLDLSRYGEKYADSANVGVMDIVDALRWIQENIEAFGGDPDNVTLFGQSGGGAKVLTMMTAPEAEGLFKRGIVQSGATETMGVRFNTKESSEKLAENLLKNLGIEADNVEALQTVSVEELEAAAVEALSQTGEQLKIPAALGGSYSMDFEPVVDGAFLPSSPVDGDSFAEAGKEVSLLIGSNLNEWTGYFKADPIPETEALKAALEKAYPDKPELTAEQVDNALIRLPILKLTDRKAAQGTAPVYSFVFAYGNSYHGAEIPYVFNHVDGDASANTLAKQISTAWINFAKTGVPSAEGLPEWEAYDREKGAAMILDENARIAYHHDADLMKLLAPDYKW